MDLSLILRFGAAIACGAIVYVAFAFVKPKNERAAMILGIAGAVEALFLVVQSLAGRYVPISWMSPLVMVGCAGAAVYGLLELADSLNPLKVRPLPGPLEAARSTQSFPLALGIGGFFALAFIVAGSRGAYGYGGFDGANLLQGGAAAAAVVAALWGAHWLSKRGTYAHWVLERRPDLVVWVYVSKLNIINRQTGSRTTTWSAIIGLESGTLVTLPALGEQQAGHLAASVAAICPDATVGYSAGAAGSFQSNPASLRQKKAA